MQLQASSSAHLFSVTTRVWVVLALMCGLQLSSANCISVSGGVIGWWAGDGNANNVLGPNNAVLQGSASASAVGKVGQAFSFDGTNDYAFVSNSIVFQPTNLTIECWVRFTSLDSPGTASPGIQYIVFKQNTRSTDFEGFDLGKSRVGGNDVFHFMVTSAGGQSVSIQSTSSVTAGVWYHLAAVRGSNFTQLYVNGALERQANVTFAQNYGNFPLYFGTSGQAYWDRKLRGNLDEVTLYDRPLSANEIAAIYNAGAAGKCKAGGSPAQMLINVDFEGAPQSAKTGPAAIGQSLSDFWNAYEGAGNWRTDGTLAFLKSANGSNTQVGLSVPNTPGSWGNYSSDPMYNGYIYPQPPAGIAMTVTNLPPANYNFYLYSSDGNFQLASGGVNYGNKVSVDNPVVSPPVWQEGRHYVVYRDVQVTNFTQAVTITVQLGVFGYATVSGMQIEANLQPWFVLQPTNTSVVDGGELILRANAFGFSAPEHRWYFNGAPLTANARVSGVASNTLSILSVTTNDAGSYWCVASNAAGVVTSAVAVVTVNPMICALPVGLVAWWTGDGQGFDSANTNHGVLSNGLAFAAGKVGQAFSFDGTNDLFRVAASDSINVGVGDGLTIECWIKPSDISTAMPLVEWNDPSKAVTYGVHLWISYSGGPGCLFANVSDTSGNNRMFSTGPGIVSADTFFHVALTYDKTTGWATLYRNGVVAATQNLGLFTPQTTFPVYLGHRPVIGESYYRGLLDEVGIYSRVLSAAELKSIYEANALGKCHQPIALIQQPQHQSKIEQQTVRFTSTATGKLPLAYQWHFNGVSLADNARVLGATNYSLVVANLQTNDAGNYWVVASNLSGVVTSQVATLTVTPPVCAPAASGLVGWWSGDGHALDAVGNNNGTLVSNVTYSVGRVGQAFVLDGDKDGVVVGNPPSLQLQNFTIETWIRRKSATQVSFGLYGNGIIFGYGQNGYSLYLDPNGVPSLTKIGVSETKAPVSVTDTNFHHLAVTKSGSLVVFYLDGVPYPAPAYDPGFTFSTVASIGMRGDNLDNSFLGLIDEVGIHNRALSAAEIGGIYNAGALGRCPLPLEFVQQPQGQTKVELQTVTLAAFARGMPPLTYQWYFNGAALTDNVRISGATNSSLSIAGLRTNDSGNYWVVASNFTGIVTSTVAVLTVNPLTCSSSANGLVAWWTGDGQPYDSANTNHGVLSNGLAFASGKVGAAFSFDGTNDLFRVVPSGSLNVGLSSGLTIECWVKPSDVGPGQALVEWNDPSKSVTFGLHFWLSIAGGAGSLYANLVDTSGNFHSFWTGSGVVAANTFVHVALTYDQTTGIGTFYRNGIVVGSQNLGVFTPQTSYPLYLGHRPSEAGNYFKGLLDEVGIYNRVLSVAEIQSIYDAGALGKCHQPVAFVQQPLSQTRSELSAVTFSATATGALPLSYQWYFNGALLADDGRVSGATNYWLTIANLQTNDTGSYRVVASNTSGSITSQVATLTVNLPLCAPTVSGLVDWWSGDNAYDYAGTNHQTLVNGVAFATGKVGMAFSFDGIDDRVTNANPKLLDVVNSTYTMEFWARPAAGRATTAESTSGLAGISNQRYAVFPDSGDTTMAGSGVSVGTNGVSVFEHGNTYLPSLLVYDAPITNWTHVAVVYQARQPRLYLNGALVKVGQTSSRTSYPSTLLGERGLNYGYYAGLLDEVSIYNRALSEAEILEVYSSQYLGKCLPPPKFVQPLADASFPLGSQIVLFAAAAGPLPLSYQWYYSNSIVADGGRLQGATSHTLVISGAQFADTGDYFVVVNNPYGSSTSTVALVQVINAPYLVEQPTNQNGVVGGGIQFVALAGGEAPFAYRWYQNATALSDDARHIGTATPNLIITNLVAGDAGNYTLRVTNVHGSVTSAVATLTVFTPPSITSQPRGYSVPLGLPVTLSGAASGTAPLQYSWLLNGVPVSNASSATLGFTNLAANQFGNYQMVVTNFGGAVTSAVASLTIGTVGNWGSYSFAANVPTWPAAGLSNVIAIAAGDSYSLALRQDGTVYAWGFSTSVTNLPPGLTGVVGIAGGDRHALALLSNGTVRAWGTGTSGQTTVPTSLSNVVAVAAGSIHSAALRADGTVVVWGGSPVDGQTNIPAGLMKVVAIDGGGSQMLALREDGSLVGWGGRGRSPLPPPAYPVPADLKNVAAFSTGPSAVLNLAVLSNGLVRAWGDSSATNVPQSVNGIIAVEGAGTSGAALAIRSNRTVVAWGFGLMTNIPGGLSNVLTLAGGLNHAVALVDDGRPLIIRPPVGGTFYSGRDLVLQARVAGNAPLSFQWFKDASPIPGGNDESLVLPSAQAGDAGDYYLVASNALGLAQSVTVPVTIVERAPVLMSQLVSRYAYYGSPFTVGASVIGSGPLELLWLQNGVLTYSGTNDLVFDRAQPEHGGSYQLVASNPFGSVTSSVAQITFSRVAAWGSGPSLSNAPVDLGTVRDIAAAYYHLLAIRSNGTVAAWGTTLNGATNVPPDLDNVVAVTGGKYFSVALCSDGTAVAWGLNSLGQTNIPSSATNLIAIAAGGDHILGLRANGTVVTWGTKANNVDIVPIGLSNVVAISAGQWHSAALKSDGTAVAWGLSAGALNSPAATNLVGLAAGFSQTFGLRPNGTVVTWMNGGQTVPTNLTEVVALASGGSTPQNFGHTFALKSDGTAMGWGNNSAGQLNFPPELSSMVKVSCGSAFTVALLNDRSPVVATQPFDRHVVSGSSVTLAALSVGQPALNFQWRQNGTDIPGAIGPTLTLTNVNRSARGYYSTLVGNALGSTNSQEAWLDVVGPVRLRPSVASGVDDFVSFIVGDSAGQSLTAGDAAWLETQASTNLVNWQTIANSLVFTNGNLILQDATQTNYPLRFYRLIER